MSELIKLGGYVVQGHGSDETVLWESATGAITGTLSEAKTNFERIKVFCVDDANNTCCLEMLSNYDKCSGLIGLTSDGNCQWRSAHVIFDGTNFTTYFMQFSITNSSIGWSGGLTSSDTLKAVKIIGVKRK